MARELPQLGEITKDENLKKKVVDKYNFQNDNESEEEDEEETSNNVIDVQIHEFNDPNSNTTTIMDEKHEHERPVIPETDVSIVSLPGHLMPRFDAAFKAHDTQIQKREGLGAGQGPAPPEPPTMETRDEAPLTIEDEETTDKIMMFAKMHAPESDLHFS